MIDPRDTLALCDFETNGIRGWSDPIEVAILFVNHELQIVGSVDTLIQAQLDMLDEHELTAMTIHGIMPSELIRAPSPKCVAKMVQDRTADALKRTRARRCILTSDNIDFESRLMRHLLDVDNPNEKGWPFHYNGMDTRMLTGALGVPGRKLQHRAMADVGALLEELRDAKRILEELKR